MLDIKSIVKTIVCEGGASGHMTHLFEDSALKFSDLKKIFKQLFTGKLSIEEKTDGQNLNITFKDGEVKAARNKATLKEPMSIKEVAAMFKGRGEIKNAFVKTMKDLQSAFTTLDEEQLENFFNNGKNFMNIEIIYPPTKNTVDYGGRCLIQFHGINIFDDNYQKVSEDKDAADKLYNMLNDTDALKQKTFEITNHTKLQLKDVKQGKAALDEIMQKLADIQQDLPDNTTIAKYVKARMLVLLEKKANELKFTFNTAKKFKETLANYICSVSDAKATKTNVKQEAVKAKFDIKSKKYLDFMAAIESEHDSLNQTAIAPLENIVIFVGLRLMKNLVGYVSADPNKSAKILADDLDQTIQQLSNKTTKLNSSDIAKFKKNLAKLEQYQREVMPAEGIVFLYKGKVYKLTSTFSAINQIMGILKY